MTTSGFDDHDHQTCVARAIAAADARCKVDGLRLTDQRRQVLRILLEDHRALGAYEVLERLRAGGVKAQPPTAYRALDFLTRHGFAHRVEHLNAFVACTRPGEAHIPAFLICQNCDIVAEMRTDGASLDEAAEDTGFAIKRTVIEAEGLCPACQAAP